MKKFLIKLLEIVVTILVFPLLILAGIVLGIWDEFGIWRDMWDEQRRIIMKQVNFEEVQTKVRELCASLFLCSNVRVLLSEEEDINHNFITLKITVEKPNDICGEAELQ